MRQKPTRPFHFDMLAVEPINLDASINSGQVFLWEKHQDIWYGVDGDNILAITDSPFKINSLNKNSNNFFRTDDDFNKILKEICKDSRVANAVKHCPGLRIFRQDPFQCYITFIISSNSNIPKIKLMLQRLCKMFGTKVWFDNKEFHLFPTPEKLASASKNDLMKCGLGYRSTYVKQAALDVVSRKIDFDYLKKCDYTTAKNLLLSVFGIGSKVADCIMLFSLEKLEACPLDRWVLRIFQKYFFDVFDLDTKSLTEKKYSEIHEKILNHFGLYAGYSQQFLFKMERDVNQKKWL